MARVSQSTVAQIKPVVRLAELHKYDNHAMIQELDPSSTIKPFDQTSQFRVEVDSLNPDTWTDVVKQFDDGCIHQTHSFGATIWGDERASHLLLFEEDIIVAATQVITVHIPGLGAGIAHCKFGPMWQRDGQERLEIYRKILHAMREEYAVRRGLFLRIKPWELAVSAAPYAECRTAAGFRSDPKSPGYETFVLDIGNPLDELRTGLKSKWRYNLKKAEKRDIEIKQSSDLSGADDFMSVYGEMRDIKTFVDTTSVTELKDLMKGLPDALCPTVFTAYLGGKPAASIVISHLGNVGYYLYGATAAEGRSSGASYVLFWTAIEWLQSRNCRFFDLVGSRARGTGGSVGFRRFKEGLTGRNGNEELMQDWEVCDQWLSRIFVGVGTWLRWSSRRLRYFLNSVRERCKKIGRG